MKTNQKQKLFSKFALGLASLVVMTSIMTGIVISATASASAGVQASRATRILAADEGIDHQKSEIKMDCQNADNLNDDCQIVEYLLMGINILSAVFAIVVIIVIIIAGIQYSASSGDPNAVGAAKKRITNALLAIAVYGATYGFLQWIVPGGVF